MDLMPSGGRGSAQDIEDIEEGVAALRTKDGFE
jgi:hypothetical protein